MPKRFYLHSNPTLPVVSPAFTGYDSTAAAVRRRLSLVKLGSTPATVSMTSTATNPELHLAVQFVSPPLLAQIISGTVKGQLRALHSNLGLNGTVSLKVWVVSFDGTTSRGTLLAISASDTGSFAGSATNRPFADSSEATTLNLTSVNALEGDRLVIEVGMRDAGTAQSGSLVFNDDQDSDLPEDSVTGTALNPWIEFSNDIVFPPLPNNYNRVRADSGISVS